ncbi:uncharacterized protein [Parasteatoda tepidariorum]|uniref:uncharacterized protein n=1 Tax=Parasteatoda tepidariorum TaxID=114398 RepID=UPI001C722A5F|nr:proline-, glutamic acid- and leucine-rich protein 1 [Parasteatoda tepidariorum]
MFPQLDLVTCPEIPLKDKVTYFASVNLFHGANIDEKQLKVVKAKINELLDSPLSRCDGLLLFEAVLQQHTPFYYENWQRIIIANLNHASNLCQEVTYRILKLIMKKPSGAPYIHNVETQVVPIIQLLISNNLTSLAAVDCLCQCMKLYPDVMSRFKNELESFLIKQMDTNSAQFSEAVADCMTVLPQCLVESNNSKKVRKSVASIFQKVLCTLQDILDSLLNVDDDKDNFMDEDSCEKPEIFKLPEMPDTEFSVVMMLARIFSSLSICAAKFLCQENTMFEVPVLWILKLIDRVFTLTDSAQMCDSIERRELIILAYPIVQKGAFTILESLVQNFGLVQHTGSFISLLKSSIKASYIATFTGGTNCQMRNTTWRILNIWLKRNGTQISVEAGNNKDLLRELLMDITPENIDETPSVTNKRHQTSAKKKNQPPAFPEPDQNCGFKRNQISTCNEALKVLHEFVSSASSFLEEKFKADIANQIFAVCHKIQMSGHPKRRLPFPYMNDKCRKNLYKIVVSLGSSSDFNIKVLQQAFAILKIAEKDKCCKINLLSQRAKGIARHLLQPKKKFPEAVTNRKNIFESPMEEDAGSGWENVVVWNNHANPENKGADSQIDIAENNASLSPETHNSVEEEEIQSKFVPEREYSSTSSLNSSRSDSENESIMEQVTVDENNHESNGTPMESPMEEDIGSGWENEVVYNTNHANQENNVADSQIDIAENNASLSPETHNSVEDEEIQNKFVPEGEYSSPSKFDTSLNSSRSDSENESIMEHVTVDENNQESNGTIIKNAVVEVTESENLNDATKTDDLNLVEKEINQNSCHQAGESRPITPTFDEMCADLVLSESSQLADS